MNTSPTTATKLWGGRFSLPTNTFVEAFSASIHYDVRLYPQDIRASQTHARMLGRQNIITPDEAETIAHGLEQVKNELDRGEMTLSASLEDIHMHVESRLRELIGPMAGKLHTARSRNDQVATDIRLHLRDETDAILTELHTLQTNLVTLAEQHITTILPGFTHLQNAQPVSLAHHLLAYVEMLERDRERLNDGRKRINRLPLGAAALAGTPFPIDRNWVAEQLGFEGICRNSMDAVADRDFAIEFTATAALIMVHLSRFSEELILWSSPSFGFVELSDAFCTGSSIMPQKKNPDVPELVRGKTGRVHGNLVSLLTLMKGLPMAYNRDMQEDKEPLFDTIDTVRGCLKVMADLVPGIQVKQQAMLKSARLGCMTATDLADYLVRKTIPFREAHEITGRIVRIAVDQGKGLEELELDDMQGVDERIEGDVYQYLTLEASVNARQAPGGTAFATVREAVAAWRRMLASR